MHFFRQRKTNRINVRFSVYLSLKSTRARLAIAALGEDELILDHFEGTLSFDRFAALGSNL